MAEEETIVQEEVVADLEEQVLEEARRKQGIDVSAWHPKTGMGKLAKEGKSSSEIGTILRDTYGVPDIMTLCKKTVSDILKEKNIAPELPDDLMALIRKSVSIRKHMEANRKDQTAKRGLMLTESLIKRLTKYYKRTGKVASEWKFDPEMAGFFTK